jgi:hypothetical protein
VRTSPKLRASRFAQIKPGELFILVRRSQRYVGLKAHDCTCAAGDEGEHLLLPIGPSLPDGMTFPTLINDPAATVVSFGQDYIVRLPTGPGDWFDDEPPEAVFALALTEDSIFLRCNFSPVPGHFRACYVNLSDGEICGVGSGSNAHYIAPPGIKAYATRWELETDENPRRTVLSYPFTSPAPGT